MLNDPERMDNPISLAKARVRALGIYPIDRIHFYDDDISSSDYTDCSLYFVLSNDSLYDVRIFHSKRHGGYLVPEYDKTRLLAYFPDEEEGPPKIHGMSKKYNKFVKWQYEFWKKEQTLETNISAVQNNLRTYEAQVQSKPITSADAHSISELYSTVQKMQQDATQMESRLLSRIEDLLKSAQDLRTKIVVQGDYIEGSKTQLKDSSMATDQGITAHDSVVTLTDRKRIQLLEDRFLRGEVSEKTYLRLKESYTKRVSSPHKIK